MASWLLGVAAVLVVAGLAVVLVGSAMRRTVARQEAGLPPLPTCPPEGTALLREEARYLGTTFAPSTVRRFNGHGLLGRGVVGLTLEDSGLRVERAGSRSSAAPAGGQSGGGSPASWRATVRRTAASTTTAASPATTSTVTTPSSHSPIGAPP